jgi:prepilin-type N-terminal cleavage/methylation domain-containing protein
MALRRGFTLLELLAVVIIVSILAVTALPQYTKAVEKTRAVQTLYYLGVLRSAETLYRAQSSFTRYTNKIAELDVEFAASLEGWGAPVINVTSAGGKAAKGVAYFTRASGRYVGQKVGMQFGTGTLCGNFEPLGLGLNCTPN